MILGTFHRKMDRVRKFVLALAFAVMPLQGIAATLTVLLCHGDAQAHATHAPASDHEHGHDHDSGRDAHHGAPSDDGGGSAFHLCCNVTATVPSFVMLTAARTDFPVRAFVPDTLHDLFIPDRPQRPPLA